MSNTEHLFENALHSLWRNESKEEWRKWEDKRHNTDYVSEETIDAIWEAAVYVVYTLFIPKNISDILYAYDDLIEGNWDNLYKWYEKEETKEV